MKTFLGIKFLNKVKIKNSILFNRTKNSVGKQKRPKFKKKMKNNLNGNSQTYRKKSNKFKMRIMSKILIGNLIKMIKLFNYPTINMNKIQNK